MTNEDRADEGAANVCRDYLELGLAAFVIRTTEEGNVRVIGPQLQPETVAQMLRAAAKAFVE